MKSRITVKSSQRGETCIIVRVVWSSNVLWEPWTKYKKKKIARRENILKSLVSQAYMYVLVAQGRSPRKLWWRLLQAPPSWPRSDTGWESPQELPLPHSRCSHVWGEGWRYRHRLNKMNSYPIILDKIGLLVSQYKSKYSQVFWGLLVMCLHNPWSGLKTPTTKTSKHFTS